MPKRQSPALEYTILSASVVYTCFIQKKYILKDFLSIANCGAALIVSQEHNLVEDQQEKPRSQLNLESR